jgi:hypothetical protein
VASDQVRVVSGACGLGAAVGEAAQRVVLGAEQDDFTECGAGLMRQILQLP